MNRIALTVLVLALAFVAGAESAKFDYPATKTVEQTDDYHGTKVTDPYRWLEDDVRVSKDVAAWVAEQNELTFSYLGALPHRGAIRAQLEKLWNFARWSAPQKHGGRYFFTRNNGLQNQDVLFVQDSLADEPRVLIDPNGWSVDGTVALSDYAVSSDGRLIAYSAAEAGSDWHVWRVMDVGTGKLLSDEIRWVKWSEAAWTPDNAGFFYSRFPEPEEGAAFQSLNLHNKVYYHRIGTPQSDDVLVFERPDHPEWGFGAEVSDDGRWLVLVAWKGTDPRHMVFVRDLGSPYAGFAQVVGEFENEYTPVGSDGDVLYFKTDLDAPRGRMIAIDVRNPAREAWREVIPQSTSTLVGVSYIGNMFVAEYLEDAKSAVSVHRRDGTKVRDIDLGGIGSVSGFLGRPSDSETFFTFESFTTPPTVYRYDVATGEKKAVFSSSVAFDPSQFDVRQVFYDSKDGTRVPMFIAHRKGLKLDGNNATLLYGYGGFNVPETPYFSVTSLVWMQMGGVYAVANLRGGGEYGEEWHAAGTKLRKQNVFDDFIAAGEWLVKNKYTKPAKLAIHGASNGGLLIGAVLNQRPDLFGAALPAVGVMDMLRFQKFTSGRYWTDDYGSSDDPEEFKALYAYSPYHNIRKGTKYPATLVTTADTDDRVVPGHSFKYTAALQAAQAGDAPVLIRIETRAGHGAGKPISKRIEEATDLWGFLAKHLDMSLPKGFGK